MWVGGSAIDEVVSESLVNKRLADVKDFTYLLDGEAQLKPKNRYTTFEVTRYMVMRHEGASS